MIACDRCSVKERAETEGVQLTAKATDIEGPLRWGKALCAECIRELREVVDRWWAKGAEGA